MTYGGFHKKKRRSKQKNFKKDTRPENLRPGGADYVPPEERPGYVAPPPKPPKPEPKAAAPKPRAPKVKKLGPGDLSLNCRDCTGSFVFSAKDQKTYEEKGYDSKPSRCPACRVAKRDSGAAGGGAGHEAKGAAQWPQPSGGSKPAAAASAKKRARVDSDAEAAAGKKKGAVKAAKAIPVAAVMTPTSSNSSLFSSDSDSDSNDGSAADEEPIRHSEPAEPGAKADLEEEEEDYDDDDDDEDENKDEDNDDEDDEDDDDKKSDSEDGSSEDEDEEAVEAEQAKVAQAEEGEDDDDAEEEEGEWDEDAVEEAWGAEGIDPRDSELCAKPLEPFDLYAALELDPASVSGPAAAQPGMVRGGGARLRAQYHRLSLRYHPAHFQPKRSDNVTAPQQQRALAGVHFRRVAVAFEALKDPERAAVYAVHGFSGLAKSEAYHEVSVLDTAPFARFDAFFEGEDPEDREYLLLEAASGGKFSDEEHDPRRRAELTEPEESGDDDDDEEKEEDEDDDEFVFGAIAAAQAEAAAAAKRGEKKRKGGSGGGGGGDVPLPLPPAGSGLLPPGTLLGFQGGGGGGSQGDPFAKVAAAFKKSKEGGMEGGRGL